MFRQRMAEEREISASANNTFVVHMHWSFQDDSFFMPEDHAQFYTHTAQINPARLGVSSRNERYCPRPEAASEYIKLADFSDSNSHIIRRTNASMVLDEFTALAASATTMVDYSVQCTGAWTSCSTECYSCIIWAYMHYTTPNHQNVLTCQGDLEADLKC